MAKLNILQVTHDDDVGDFEADYVDLCVEVGHVLAEMSDLNKDLHRTYRLQVRLSVEQKDAIVVDLYEDRHDEMEENPVMLFSHTYTVTEED